MACLGTHFSLQVAPPVAKTGTTPQLLHIGSLHPYVFFCMEGGVFYCFKLVNSAGGISIAVPSRVWEIGGFRPMCFRTQVE